MLGYNQKNEAEYPFIKNSWLPAVHMCDYPIMLEQENKQNKYFS